MAYLTAIKRNAALMLLYFIHSTEQPLMSTTDLQYCLISTSHLAGLFTLSYYFIFDGIVCCSDFLPMRTLCDAYHNEFESH